MPADVLVLGFAAVGGAVALSFVVNALSFVYTHFLRPAHNLKKKYGLWAVVTGATDGIGKGMAFEFARKGHNVVLISRSKDKLLECAKELNDRYPKVEVKVLDIDFAKFDEAARARVVACLNGLDVGILVNNVGISYPYTKYFHELDDERVTQLITLNVDSTTWMTRIVLPGMVARKRGAMVNMGSGAGVSVSPLLAQYGAAKSYVAMFSKAMNAELASFGIHVQCQVPLFVATKLAKIKHASLFVASPSGYARAAVACIGYESLVSPFWTHAIQIWLLNALPEWVVTRFVMLPMHKGIRAAGMKKDAKALAEGSAAGGNNKKNT